MQRDRNPGWRRIKSGPFHRIGDSYGHFFNSDHFMGRSAFDSPWLVPEILSNVKKTEEHYEIELALPGYQKEDISIAIEGGLLKVKAERNDEYKDEYLTREIHFDTVNRHFQLDPDVDIDKVRSVFEHGLLKISLPHNGESSVGEKRKIEVA